MVDLLPFGVDLLPEIPLPTCQRHEHHRQFEVGGRAHRIAGEDAQASGIGVHLASERDFHGEIGNPCSRQVAFNHRHCILQGFGGEGKVGSAELAASYALKGLNGLLSNPLGIEALDVFFAA